MIKFDTTQEELHLIQKIIDRVAKMDLAGEFDLLTLAMDLSATNANGCPLDFEKLLHFDNFDFAHDISGIAQYINRSTGQLTDCFLPRCAKQ